MINKLTHERLKEVFDYNQKTGIFTWKISTCTKVRVGDIAGCFKDGYIQITIDKQLYYAHRLAWFYVYGYFPEHDVDHKNRIKTDNWIDNLREATRSCNMRNTGQRITNTSGVKGVSLHKPGNKWIVNIVINKKQIYLGLFDNFDEAVMARWEAEKLYKFPNCCSDSIAYQYLKDKKLI